MISRRWRLAFFWTLTIASALLTIYFRAVAFRGWLFSLFEGTWPACLALLVEHYVRKLRLARAAIRAA